MAANAWRPERSTRVAVELKLAETLLTEPRLSARIHNASTPG
jgi:hypothetical protein